MKTIASFLLLACVAALAACMQPMTEAEREYQARAEQERRLDANNRK